MKKIWLVRRSTLPLLLVAYLTWGAVGAIWWSTTEREHPTAWAGGGMLLTFALLMALNPEVLAPLWRHLYLAAQSALAAGLLLMETRAWSAIPILFFILSAFAMLLWPHRRSFGWLWIGLFALLTGGILAFRLGWENGLLTLLPYAGGYAFFGVFAEALARAEEAHRQTQSLLAELQEAHHQLRAYASRVEELAVAEEHNRMAREMHDALGHHLTVAAVQLEGAERLIPADPQRAVRMVQTAREEVREALTELRETVAA
ncbi:MAG: sensor histidine kinase, partial [Chloroflexia bacterium]